MSDTELQEQKEADLPKISRRCRRFAEEYVIHGCSKAEAYRRAFAINKKWDAQRIADNAYQISRRPEVRAYIEHLQRELNEEYEARKHQVMEKLFAIATANMQDLYDESGQLIPIHKLPRHVAASINAIKVEELFSGRGEDRVQVGVLREVKQLNPNEAIGELAQIMGWRKNKLDVDLNAPPPVIQIAPYPDADEAEAKARDAVSRHASTT